MKKTSLSVYALAAQGNGLARLLDSGKLRLYSGIMPSDSDAYSGGSLTLAEFKFSNPSAPECTDGVIDFEFTGPAIAFAKGFATWFRAFSYYDEQVFDGTVGTSDANLILDNCDIQPGKRITIGSFQHEIFGTFAPGL
jgi:hypothetical protein